MSVISPYEHRQNHETSFDSICTTCYQTVGKRKTEAGLEQDKKVHACNGRPLRGIAPLVFSRLRTRVRRVDD
jgi:hypothetical protein